MNAAWSFAETTSDFFRSVIDFLVPNPRLPSLALRTLSLLVNLIFLIQSQWSMRGARVNIISKKTLLTSFRRSSCKNGSICLSFNTLRKNGLKRLAIIAD